MRAHTMNTKQLDGHMISKRLLLLSVWSRTSKTQDFAVNGNNSMENPSCKTKRGWLFPLFISIDCSRFCQRDQEPIKQVIRRRVVLQRLCTAAPAAARINGPWAHHWRLLVFCALYKCLYLSCLVYITNTLCIILYQWLRDWLAVASSRTASPATCRQSKLSTQLCPETLNTILPTVTENRSIWLHVCT